MPPLLTLVDFQCTCQDGTHSSSQQLMCGPERSDFPLACYLKQAKALLLRLGQCVAVAQGKVGVWHQLKILKQQQANNKQALVLYQWPKVFLHFCTPCKVLCCQPGRLLLERGCSQAPSTASRASHLHKKGGKSELRLASKEFAKTRETSAPSTG